MDDRELLRRFIEEQCQQSFAELVRRHIDMVYSAARRQINDATLADDVTQLVFVLLARKARMIRRREAIAGWLLAATRHVALNELRGELRRRHHEKKSAQMRNQTAAPDQADWESIKPVLDEAIAELRPADRDAVTLRYLQSRSYEEIALTMRISQGSARRRVGRAVEKLRKHLAARGIHTPAESLATVLMGNTLIAAPAHLSARIVHSAASATMTSSAGASKGALIFMALSNTKLSAITAIVLLLAIAPVVYLAHKWSTVPPAASIGPKQGAAAPIVVSTEWKADFQNAYALKPGENVRRIPWPSISSRQKFVAENNAYGDHGDPQQSLLILWNGETLRYVDGGDGDFDLCAALRTAAGIWPQDTDIPRNLYHLSLPGDWVVREGATPQQKVGDVCAAFAEVLGTGMVLKQEPMMRRVIVARGALEYHALQNMPLDSGQLRIGIFTNQLPNPRTDIAKAGDDPTEIFQLLGELMGRPVVVEADLGGNRPFQVYVQKAANYFQTPEAAPEEVVRQVLNNLSKQTSLEFSLEDRMVPTWRLVKS